MFTGISCQLFNHDSANHGVLMSPQVTRENIFSKPYRARFAGKSELKKAVVWKRLDIDIV